jgi:LysM repeat protein
LIRVGQVLRIPEAKAPATAAAPKPAVISAVPKPAASEEALTAEKFIAIKNGDGAAKAAASPKATAVPAATGDVYVVAKGDNPYSIAKKLSVSYNELLSINNIDDPTKLQIGQKLKIPTKSN